MPALHTLIAFALVSVGIMLMPGPSNFFLLAHGITHGRRAALAAMFGIEVASASRVLFTAAGFSALVAASPTALGVVRWAGVLYLAYLGIRSFRSTPADPFSGTGATVPLHRSARKGLMVGLANPKMMVFFLAFFPQFIDPSRGSHITQVLILGAIFWVIGVVWDLWFACLAGTIGLWLHRHPHLHTALPRVEGGAYVSLAGWAAIAGA